MIVAHLPAGYLLHRALTRRSEAGRKLLWVSLLGSVFPDVDLLYFYGPGRMRVPHHLYWTHLPTVWLVIWCGLWLLTRLRRLSSLRLPLVLFMANIGLHLVLDTIVGGIYWAWPFSLHKFRLFDVPARYQNPFLNLILNWTFSLEIAICAVAALVFLIERKRQRAAELLCRDQTSERKVGPSSPKHVGSHWMA